MRPPRMLPRVIAGILLGALGAALLAAPARAQEPPAAAASRDEQIRRIRQLPLEEQRRLKEALERFRALPPAEREALRRKAREVGIERLGELAGRNVEKLRARHLAVQRGLDEIMKLLDTPGRLESLSEDERAYVRAMAMRGFETHCRIRLLEGIGRAAGFDALLPAEKKDLLAKAAEAAFQRLLDEKPADEKDRILKLPAAEQRRERVGLFAEWRLRETTRFFVKFEHFRFVPFLQMTPEKRTALLGRRVRWFQLAALLSADGAGPEVLTMLRQLSADERASVSLVYEQSQDQEPAGRRARVEAKIRELYGRAALDPTRARRPLLPEILRDRALRERHAGKPGGQSSR